MGNPINSCETSNCRSRVQNHRILAWDTWALENALGSGNDRLADNRISWKGNKRICCFKHVPDIPWRFCATFDSTDNKNSSMINVSITIRIFELKQRRKSPWSGSRTHTSGTSNVGFSNTSHAIYATLPRSLGYLRQIYSGNTYLNDSKRRSRWDKHRYIEIIEFFVFILVQGSKKGFGSSRSSTDTIGCLHIKQSFLKQPLSRFTFLLDDLPCVQFERRHF